MTEKINPENYIIIKIYTFKYWVKFLFWVSVCHYCKKGVIVNQLQSIPISIIVPDVLYFKFCKLPMP